MQTITDLTSALDACEGPADDSASIGISLGMLRQLFKGTQLMEVGRDLVKEAMREHIYDEGMGEAPEPDCAYRCHVEDADALLEQLGVIPNAAVPATVV
mgnify:CR=1 FL=1|jgi:hypothetical protein